jgi:Tfp pilus assembly protein PilF
MSLRTWFVLLLIVAGVVAYSDSFQGIFLFDDQRGIVTNEHIRHPLDSAGWFLASGRPLVMATLAANYAISHYDVWSYHAFNLAVHIAAGLTLFGLVRRTLLLPRLRERYGRHADGLALASALLWLLHPLQTESVTYIIQRAESLMGLFYLLTFYCFIRGVETSTLQSRWLAGAIVSCALGMATKEVMVTAPVLLLLFDRIYVAASFRDLLRARWKLYAGLAATWLVLSISVQIALGMIPDPAGGGGMGFHVQKLTPWSYALSESAVLTHYLRLVFWPYPLCLDYEWPVARGLDDVGPSLILIVSLLAANAWALWRWPCWGFLGVAFFLVLAPTSSVVPIVDLAFEHRMYLALAPVSVAVVIACYELLKQASVRWHWQAGRRFIIAWSLLSICALVLGAATFCRNLDYWSDLRIWQQSLDVRPGAVRPRLNLGMALAKRGDWARAAEQFQRILDSHPDDVEANQNMGWVLAQDKQWDRALDFLHKAILLDPQHATAHVNLGQVLYYQKQVDEAIVHFRQALEINNSDAVAHFNLAQALIGKGQLDEAIEHYQAALAIRPELLPAQQGLERARMRKRQASSPSGER